MKVLSYFFSSNNLFLKISDHQQSEAQPFPEAILILPALPVIADF
jgi:hypothetical protein